MSSNFCFKVLFIKETVILMTLNELKLLRKKQIYNYRQFKVEMIVELSIRLVTVFFWGFIN